MATQVEKEHKIKDIIDCELRFLVLIAALKVGLSFSGKTYLILRKLKNNNSREFSIITRYTESYEDGSNSKEVIRDKNEHGRGVVVCNDIKIFGQKVFDSFLQEGVIKIYMCTSHTSVILICRDGQIEMAVTY